MKRFSYGGDGLARKAVSGQVRKHREKLLRIRPRWLLLSISVQRVSQG